MSRQLVFSFDPLPALRPGSANPAPFPHYSSVSFNALVDALIRYLEWRDYIRTIPRRRRRIVPKPVETIGVAA